MKSFLTLSILAVLTVATVPAQVPQIINYQGQVAVGNARYDGTGQFRFALVNSAGDATYWSHNGTSTAAAEPTGVGIALPVTLGQFSVGLGDTAIPGMTQPISPTVFLNNGLYLRVWFSDGQHPFERLTPDLRLASVGYAMTAATVPDGSITAAKLADGAVQAGNIAAGQVVNQLNGLKDAVTLAAGTNVTLATNGQTLTISASGGGTGGVWAQSETNISYIAGNVGIGTNSPQTALHVSGAVAIGNTTDTSTSPPAGTMRWTGTDFEGYTGTNWVSLTGRGNPPPTNTVSPYTNMVWIPPGTFVMGSPDSEVDRYKAEGPQTTVTLTRGFYMSKYEVTQGEYLSLMNTNPSYYTGDPNRPVETVSWYDAVSYCLWLTQRERDAGRIPASYQYRLPTEAEWEYACRAGTTTRFSYGDDPGYTLLPNYAWYAANNNDYTTHPVGQRLHNPWGLDDMHGNVWEWCQDWNGAYPGGVVTDPQGPGTGSGRVIRGGSYFSSDINCRSADRFYYRYPSSSFDGVGFRVVLAPGQP